MTYIGDLTINWIGNKSKISGGFGLVGALIDEANNDGDIEIYSKNNLAEFASYFSEKYNNNMEIEYFDLSLPDPDNFWLHTVFGDPSKNPNLFTFSLTNDVKCYGKLRILKKKKVYVDDGKNLYIFDRNRLISITDFNKKDITEEVMSQKKFKRINYNSYEVIEY